MEIAPEEEFLTARCLAGEREAFADLGERYGAPLLGFIRCAHPSRAADWEGLAVEALALSLRRSQPFDEKIPLGVRMMRRLVEILNREKNEAPAEKSAELSKDPRLQYIQRGLESVLPPYRYLILLRDQMDYSFEEIAFILGMPEEKVKADLSQARLQFHQNLHQMLTARRS